MKATLAAAFTVLFSFSFSASATTLATFGDSLSDGGNVQVALAAGGGSLPPVYPNGQFTNGDAWTTQLGLTPSLLGGTNFAYGGATAVDNGDTTPDLLAQIDSYLASGIDADVATVWVGGNDFLALPPNPTFTQLYDTVSDVVGTIALGVQTLALSGIDEILVFGLPDLGLSPRYASDPIASGQASLLTNLYNGILVDTLSALDALLPSSVGYFDTNSLFLQAVAMVPQDLMSVPCIANPVDCAANPQNYVFYDDIHPTEWVHALLAAAVAEEVGLEGPSEVPLPASAPLLLACLGGLAVVARRRRSRA